VFDVHADMTHIIDAHAAQVSDKVWKGGTEATPTAQA
jgi:hypothetical protein